MTEDQDAAPDAHEPEVPEPVSKKGRRIAGTVATVAVVVAVAIPVIVLATGPDDAITDAEREAVATAASEAAVSVLSYRAETVADDVAAAKGYLTGDFLTYYSAFAEDSVVPGAVERGITSSATVSAAGTVSIENDDAVALLFVNQNVTSTDSPDPRSTSTSLRIELVEVDGRWLVSALDTV
ncbi:MAG: hypothetical protein WBF79_05230 [Rhodococcus sp. (in: high G+C Gram-positive bacteria)]